MSNSVSNVNFQIDTDIKQQADSLFSKLGLSMETALNIFLRQSIREGSIPFHITTNTPNSETVSAMLEAESIAKDLSIKRYSDVEEALRELKL